MYSHYSHFKKNRFERFFVTISLIISLIVFISPAPLTYADDVVPPPADTTTTPPPADTTTTPPPADTPAVTPPADASVTTGSAVSTSDTTNVANVNTTNTNPAPVDASSTSQGTDASSTPSSSAPTDTNVSNTNDASTTNTTDVGATTGGNASSNNAGGGSVTTGTAVAAANILNVVNVNIFNSNGFLMMLNNLFGNLGTIDLRDLAASLSGGLLDGNTCNCGPINTNVSNNNIATISNSVVVRASTGGNDASGNGGSGVVATGDAYAAANVVNVANTNITNSNYMMLVLNNLGTWNGNFVLPNAGFFSNFLSGNTGTTNVSNTNTATVNNNVGVTADTGSNTANGNGGTSAIQTGNATAGANVVNQVNQNLFGGSSVILLFRIFGNWNGSVFNAPPGISWAQTPQGVELFQDPSYTGGTGSSTANCNCGDSTTNVSNTNTATVNNNVQVYALTGQNQVNGNAGAGSVSTGNAVAGANVVNLVNNNIYGRNWILAIVNIFGDWNGSISFGEPDLWIGASASVDSNSSVTRGTPLSYGFTIANRGDADAHNVKLHGKFDNPYITFDDATSTDSWWNVGTIPAGKTVQVSYPATVSGGLPGGTSALALTASVSEDEPDHNQSDNSDMITLAGVVTFGNGNGVGVTYTADPDIVVTKTNDAPSRISASTTVNYTIKIKNNGGPAYDAQLQDELKNDAGQTVSTNSWDLATVKANEEVTITYAMNFNEKTPAGVYVNTAHVEALGRNPSVNPLYGIIYESPEASSTVVVLPDNAGFPGFVGGGDEGAGTTTVGGFTTPKIHTPKVPMYEGSKLLRTGGIGMGGGTGGGDNLKNEIAKYLPLAFSADSVKPLKLGKGGLGSLAGLGFSIPNVGTLDLLILLILVLLLIASRYSFKELEAKFKNRFASFL